MVYLYGRKIRVDVDNLRIENLNVSFDISYEKLDFGKAEIKIYNLNKTHRKAIEDSKSSTVSLSVGYEGTAYDRIFFGEMRRSFSEKKGGWITTLQTGDGDKAAKSRINKSYRPKTPKRIVWADLVKALKSSGIGVGNAIQKFQSGSYQDGIDELIHGGASSGKTLKLLKKMARSAGLDVQIQDQELVISAVGEPLDATAVVLSPRSGLIGNPQKGVDGELKARALIIPGLRPKRLVQIESPSLSGLYVIEKSKYKGEIRGQDWYVDMECKER